MRFAMPFPWPGDRVGLIAINASRLAGAQLLVRQHDAHLTGFCALERQPPPDLSFALGGYPDPRALPEFARQIEEPARGMAHNACIQSHGACCNAETFG